ncbi:MAG: macro domain-containing protein [Peptostreptococcaceae bacterium]|jgi:O-acetyl-ADP-ribose deacetylase (regulator of RNase III)/uncharacterized protein YwgA|nr:macro domain-containing protein [Peptostreptococcaceae bacterium]
MFIYTTGDLLKSDAQALVNTVNCEGYMGKGIAYQFKLNYPENNKSYVKVCKSGELTVGKMYYFCEGGKLIINFPTKNKWREKSKMEYIVDGLDDLRKIIVDKNIKSIAIPPLGSGNGGLVWSNVKKEIINKLSSLSEDVKLIIYEPSMNYNAQPVKEPKLSTSALVLMELKKNLNKFDTLRLQKSAYIMNILLDDSYFKFKRHKYGPYDYSISIISKNIKEYQKFHSVKNTEEAYKILYQKIISDKVKNKMNELRPAIIKSAEIVNSIDSNKELECITTIIYLIQEKNTLNNDEIIKFFKEWSEDKANRFSRADIEFGINKLVYLDLIQKNMIGYEIIK